MLTNEIKILRRLNHPNIVKLYEVYEFGEEICLVMEYVAGEKLFNYIINNGKLSEEETSVIIKQPFLFLSLLIYKFMILSIKTTSQEMSLLSKASMTSQLLNWLVLGYLRLTEEEIWERNAVLRTMLLLGSWGFLIPISLLISFALESSCLYGNGIDLEE